MATLTISNVPPAVLAVLESRAADSQRTVAEEVLSLIEVHADPRVPHIFLTPEIPAPFDLEISGPGETIVPRDVPNPGLEFWYDEHKGAE